MKKGMDNVNRRFKDLDPDKIEEGDIFRTADGSVFKAIGAPDYTVKVVLAKCLQSNNIWHVFGDKLYISALRTLLSYYLKLHRKVSPLARTLRRLKNARAEFTASPEYWMN